MQYRIIAPLNRPFPTSEWFRVKLPDDVCAEYNPVRRHYAKIAKEEVREEGTDELVS